MNKHFNFELLCCLFHDSSWLNFISQYTMMSSYSKGKQDEALWLQQDTQMGIKAVWESENMRVAWNGNF